MAAPQELAALEQELQGLRTEPEQQSTSPSSDQSPDGASDPISQDAVAEVPANAPPNPSPGTPLRCPSELYGAPAYRDAASGGPAEATADARVAALSRLQAILFTSFSVRDQLVWILIITQDYTYVVTSSPCATFGSSIAATKCMHVST